MTGTLTPDAARHPGQPHWCVAFFDAMMDFLVPWSAATGSALERDQPTPIRNQWAGVLRQIASTRAFAWVD